MSRTQRNLRLALPVLTLLISCALLCVPAMTSGSSGSVSTAKHAVAPAKGRLRPFATAQESDKLRDDSARGHKEQPASNDELEMIETTPPPGDFRPGGQLVGGSKGLRSLVLAADAGKEVEPNGTSGTATPLVGAAVRIRGNIFPAADIDFYSFTATTGDRIYAAVQTLFDASASGDSTLELLNTDGSTVLELDNNDGTFNANSSSIAGFLIPATGTYFLRVKHNTAAGTIRPYDLHFNRLSGAPVAETEPNETPGTATPLPASGWVSGTITATQPTEQDFYSLTLAAGDSVFLSLDMNPERDASVWNGRLGFGLFGNPPANQILLANDANAGASSTDPNSEAFFFTVKDAGTYFVYVDSIVAAGLGATATYNLAVSVYPEVVEGVNCTTYTSTNVPQAIPTGPGMVTSTITVPGNPRIADLNVTINLNHTFMQDLDVHLVSPAGNDNGLFTDIGAATVGGPQTLMNLRIDDEAALPFAFGLSASFVVQPESAYRLGWFDGENAGGTWTLVIRDDATGDGGTLNSWSITVCEPTAPPACGAGFVQTTVFSTDFEAGAAGFTHSGTADEWELGLPNFVPITTCNSGVNCWKTDLDNTYDINSNQNLVSPNISLAGLSGPVRLNWAMRYSMESASFDHAFVEARQVGNPSNAVRVFDWRDATMTDTPGNPTVTIAESAGWAQYSADISALAGLNIELVFHLDSDSTVNLTGLAIDDVSVTACMVAPCVLTCPANISQSNDSNQCGAAVSFTPSSTGACGTVSCSPASGSFFPVGATTVTCKSNNGAGPEMCTFTVTVNDTQAPAVVCPANITTVTAAGVCTANVNYTVPVATDNCPGPMVVCSPAAGSSFPKGTTTVTCTATDASSNTSNCMFTITVNDNQPPTVTCPSNISVPTGGGPGGCNTVTYTTPTASDNCGASVVCAPASGTCFLVGTTTVTCTATDAASNTGTCSFTVTVAPPCMITCPANVTKANDPNQCGAVVNYPAPTTTGSCGTVTCSPASGSFFPKGSTTVTCTSTAGPSCSFAVIVNDTQPPTITCPANKSVKTATLNDPCVVVIFTTIASDNCPGVTVVCNPPSGSCFPVGSSTVTCTATDSSSNTATCSFTVSVFNVCLQDDSNPSSVFLGNSITGAYRFCCGGTTYTGIATVTKRGSVITFQQTAVDRRVQATDDESVFKGTASLQAPPGTNKCTITDKDTRNNSCNCP